MEWSIGQVELNGESETVEVALVSVADAADSDADLDASVDAEEDAVAVRRRHVAPPYALRLRRAAELVASRAASAVVAAVVVVREVAAVTDAVVDVKDEKLWIF
ncbi:unnamed protein product [Litomosoides sigmodontis]|uniref:Uncharacterized protein n=1 Tax=Litomosoides sigmodontis TaxID=42156 RepID=A0A3P6TWN5_LITSI|nr:unnamed protein product [Litomosoides sigmodontis]